MPSKTNVSRRFTRAARSERNRLCRARARLDRKRKDLRGRLDLVAGELEAVDLQLRLLEEVADTEEWWPGEAGAADDGTDVLRGASIRDLAVPILLRRNGIAPIHYRDWYLLLLSSGYAVAGRRPDAVFLSQVSRSPIVRRSTRPGFYVVDPTVTEDLRQALARNQEELGEMLTQIPADGSSLEAHRVRRRELDLEIARIERHLAEAVAAIEAAGSGRDLRVEQTG